VSSAKKIKPVPIVPPWLRQIVVLLFGPGRTITLAMLLTAGFCGGAWAVWRHVEKHIENSPEYSVSAEQITITPPPEWVRTDIRAEAFRMACPPDQPLSSLDDGLTQRLAMAFMLHPWVAKATVTKRAPSRVNVDLVYRRPVCMVELANGSGSDLLPVDCDGVCLPGEDFSQKQKESYPCIAGIDHRPIQPAGHPWGDARVVDGASIAAALLPYWQRLKLYRIQVAANTPSQSDAGTLYELYTRAGTRVVWGSAREISGAGEPSTEEKVARLLAYAATRGSLDAGPSLDVRKIPSAARKQ